MTLGVGEPFTTTITVALVLRADHLAAGDPVRAVRLRAAGAEPAASAAPRCRCCSRPVPVRRAACCSATSSCCPAAVRFFVNFNASEFNMLVQASQFYKFAATILLAMGLVFQVPGRDPRRDAARARDPAASCARTAATRSWPARRSRRSCPATRSRCCSRRYRCICSTRRVSCWRRSSTRRGRRGRAMRAARATDGAGPRASGRRHHRRDDGADRAADHRPRRREPLD